MDILHILLLVVAASSLVVLPLRADDVKHLARTQTLPCLAAAAAAAAALTFSPLGYATPFATLAALLGLLRYALDVSIVAPTIGDIKGKSVVVTGGNSGLGLAVASACVEFGARSVTITARSKEKGDAAVAQIRAQVGDKDAPISAQVMTLSSLDSIRATVAAIDATHEDGLDVLFNNGGTLPTAGRRTAEGYEEGIGAMHFGHFQLTQGLLPTLFRSPAPPVVVNVASEGHRMGKFSRTLFSDPKGEGDLRGEKIDGGFPSYARAKLANVLFSKELHKRMGSRLTAVSMHPGAVYTNIWSTLPVVIRQVVQFGGFMVMRSPRAAARLALGAATAPAVRGGMYLEGTGSWSVGAPSAQDPKLAHRLWEVSEIAVGTPPR